MEPDIFVLRLSGGWGACLDRFLSVINYLSKVVCVRFNRAVWSIRDDVDLTGTDESEI